jgi:hypothetical protein
LQAEGRQFKSARLHQLKGENMPPEPSGTSPIVAAIFGIFWLLFMVGMTVGYIILLIAWWRAMKAHEKIANKLSEIADKFQPK